MTFYGNLSHNLMTSVGFSFLVSAVISVRSFLSHSYHFIEFDRIIVTFMLTQHKLMTSVSMGIKCQEKTDACFFGNDTEQLLSPHTYSLLRRWWL